MLGLKPFQTKFIQLALESKALEFGNFTLKSGRSSPYFFNAANMLNGCNLHELSLCYEEAIKQSGVRYDCIFGPAYKGIFLGSMVATLQSQRGRNYPLSFNRKEAKDHGEGGNIIGASPHGDVMIIDDVLSAGTAAKESIELIQALGAMPKLLIVGLNRQEKGSNKLGAKEELERDFGITVQSIIDLDTLIQFLKTDDHFNKHVNEFEVYQKRWGA